MKLTKIIILTILFSFITLQASALSFNNLSVGGTGSINTGNGYFDDDASQFSYTGSRNIYTVTEDTQIHILEPISYAGGSSGAIEVINSSFGTLKDSVVHNGYLYFVDGTTLKKKNTRSNTGTCESNDTSAGGCITTISTGVGGSLRVYDGVLYFTTGTTGFKHLDIDDNVVDNFAICAPNIADTQRYGGYSVTKNNSILQVYALCPGNPVTFQSFTSTGNTILVPSGYGNAGEFWATFYTTTNYIYMLGVRTGGGNSFEKLTLISNSSMANVNYVATDTIEQNSRVYVSGLTTIGLMASSATTYETFNSNEAGVSSLPLSEGAGIVQYVEKSIVVPNPTYFNDSIIPFVIDLKFIISEENHTNYQDSLFWHVKVDDPRGLQVYDLNLPAIACTSTDLWWDILGLFSTGDFSCDGSGTVYYTPAPGQFWLNGTWRVNLTEEIPGTISILSTDTWVITNESANNTGVINPPPPCPNCGLGTGGTINTNTSLQIIQVFSFVAFWGFIIWLGIVGSVIAIMAKSPSGVNGLAVIVVAWLSAVFIALIGLFDPFKIYIIVLSTIIAAVLFRFGRNATTTEE